MGYPGRPASPEVFLPEVFLPLPIPPSSMALRVPINVLDFFYMDVMNLNSDPKSSPHLQNGQN